MRKIKIDADPQRLDKFCQIEIEPDWNARIFRSTMPVFRPFPRYFSARFRKGTFEKYLKWKQVDERGKKVIRRLFQISGVEEIRVFNPYEMSIRKNRLYDWEEMELEIVRVVKNSLGKKETVTAVFKILDGRKFSRRFAAIGSLKTKKDCQNC